MPVVLRHMPVVESLHLSEATPEEILSAYAQVSLSIGMRGHAQLIPFGMRRRVVSIVSHDKLKWFLDDVNMPQAAVDVHSRRFEADLKEAIAYITSMPDQFYISKQHSRWLRTQKKDRKSTRLNSSHSQQSRMPSSA